MPPKSSDAAYSTSSTVIARRSRMSASLSAWLLGTCTVLRDRLTVATLGLNVLHHTGDKLTGSGGCQRKRSEACICAWCLAGQVIVGDKMAGAERWRLKPSTQPTCSCDTAARPRVVDAKAATC